MRALITAAEGDIERFYQVSRPTFVRYAQRHGFELREGPWDRQGRHPYWLKLAAIIDQWNHYEEILWVDADIIIKPDAPDIFGEIEADSWLGIAEHVTHEGRSPNVGVMAIRTTAQAREFFSRCWRRHAKFKSHRWPDQAPVMELLGYSTTLPVSKIQDTVYTDGVTILGPEWNALPRFGGDGHFLHFAGLPIDARLALASREGYT